MKLTEREEELVLRWAIDRIGEEQDVAIRRQLSGTGPRPNWRAAANESLEELYYTLSRMDIATKEEKTVNILLTDDPNKKTKSAKLKHKQKL